MRMGNEKVAVVTGANKGIGFAIVDGLCKKYDGIVYLTARNETLGEAAVAKLRDKGLNARFHQLDVTDQSSVDKFKDHIQSEHGGLDVLINNAGVAYVFSQNESASWSLKVEKSLQVNYFGVLRVCETLFPLLKQNSKVVNMSSSFGFPKYIASKKVRAKFTDKNLTKAELNKIVKQYISDAKARKDQEEGWGTSAYIISKVAVSALSIIQQKEFDKETPSRNIAVNHVHPGYVDTDMTDHKGISTTEEGAKSALYCVFEADFKGKYVWEDCQVVDWYGETLPSPRGAPRRPFPEEVD